MSSVLPFIELVSVTGILGLLPFVPAFVELHRKTDAQPLDIIRDHDGNIRRFAGGLRAYLEGQLDPEWLIPDGKSCVEGLLKDGTPVQLVRASEGLDPTPYVMSEPPAQRMVVSYRPLILPPNAALTMDLYAAETLHGGEGAVYRAILSDREIYLARGSTVLRWVHTEESLWVEPGSRLYGRASAEQRISLGEGCRFERLHAARIEFGQAGGVESGMGDSEGDIVVSPGSPLPTSPALLPRVVDVAGRRSLVRGDLTLPAGSVFTGDLVVTGNLRVGAGSRIAGSVKCHREILLSAGARVEGSLVSCRSVVVGPGCSLGGPVLAEREIVVETGAHLGRADRPTTVSAPRLSIQPGVVAFGTVWARSQGEVTGDESRQEAVSRKQTAFSEPASTIDAEAAR